MDRRKALRNMGLALGYTVATPTLISIVQSCKQEPSFEWTPDFFSKDEGAVLTKLVDIILPKTDTPSASETQVHLFIDRFALEVMDEKQQNFVNMSIGRFIEKALIDSGKEKGGELSAEELEPVLAEALSVSKEDEAKNFEAIKQYHEAVAEGKEPLLDDGISRFAFANNLRGLTIMGYKTSEYVGENVLAYLPVPGEFIACGDLQELTGGKAWSL
ncbi:gluconate 2-dehydrogenase subunit 3 family protein [Cytophaga sp. FL35]|uniref:gluconate 2-dehydrogenase subunit 3 family protein n=1 Tax=Cytophaga sp. FL35 TaxID=1904456 RepID=UPI001653B5EC|nr:gluconate 2-dehydrogenase subunit 3 family protein [Cytophaga sp. FL35]MBC6997387.1 gluconate 2-dehydrogenase subunit 3 family protein [Cytophaga sp. FL35]